jgi:hypothetical protein
VPLKGKPKGRGFFAPLSVWGETSVTRKRAKGTELKVFSGREAALNFVIFLVLCPEGKLLASYDVFREVRAIKGFRRKGRQNIDRRLKALSKQRWIDVGGTMTIPIFKTLKSLEKGSFNMTKPSNIVRTNPLVYLYMVQGVRFEPQQNSLERKNVFN